MVFGCLATKKLTKTFVFHKICADKWQDAQFWLRKYSLCTCSMSPGNHNIPSMTNKSDQLEENDVVTLRQNHFIFQFDLNVILYKNNLRKMMIQRIFMCLLPGKIQTIFPKFFVKEVSIPVSTLYKIRWWYFDDDIWLSNSNNALHCRITVWSIIKWLPYYC